MYQLLLKNGQKIGQYSPNGSPAKTAEKIAKVMYETEGMKGKREFEFTFVKNRTIAEGGDKVYEFRALVEPLARTKENIVSIAGKTFYKKYNIQVLNLLRV